MSASLLPPQLLHPCESCLWCPGAVPVTNFSSPPTPRQCRRSSIYTLPTLGACIEQHHLTLPYHSRPMPSRGASPRRRQVCRVAHIYTVPGCRQVVLSVSIPPRDERRNLNPTQKSIAPPAEPSVLQAPTPRAPQVQLAGRLFLKESAVFLNESQSHVCVCHASHVSKKDGEEPRSPGPAGTTVVTRPTRVIAFDGLLSCMILTTRCDMTCAAQQENHWTQINVVEVLYPWLWAVAATDPPSPNNRHAPALHPPSLRIRAASSAA